MSITRNILSFPRFALLSILALIGPILLAAAIPDWLGNVGTDNFILIVRTVVNLIFTALFLAIKFTNFLKPSEKLETLVRTKVSAAGSVIKQEADAAAQRMERAAEARLQDKQFKQTIHDRSSITPFEVTVLGGSGWEQKSGQAFVLSMDSVSVYLTDTKARTDFPIAISEVIDVEIGGPGAQTSSAGVMGGGFGLQGAATGIAIASAINMLTTRSSVNTLIRLATPTSEVFLHTSAIDPATARMQLSALFVKVNNGPERRTQID